MSGWRSFMCLRKSAFSSDAGIHNFSWSLRASFETDLYHVGLSSSFLAITPTIWIWPWLWNFHSDDHLQIAQGFQLMCVWRMRGVRLFLFGRASWELKVLQYVWFVWVFLSWKLWSARPVIAVHSLVLRSVLRRWRLSSIVNAQWKWVRPPREIAGHPPACRASTYS